MDADRDLWQFEPDLADAESLSLEGADAPPPVAAPGERPRRTGPDGASDLRQLTWVLLGVVVALSVLKLALFTVGGSLAAALLGAAFVAAHGALIAAGATWFWPLRYG